MWLTFLLLLVSAWAWADAPAPQIQVRVYQVPAGELVEGETAQIKVDMLTSEFFTDAPVLPQLHVDGAYLSLSDETPAHLVETVDGATWSGVSRTYLVTPLISGSVEIPAFDINAHVGPTATPVSAQTKPLTLQVQALTLPAGVTEALIASAVTVTQTITPQSSGLHLGDSVTRRIDITAQGAPAMMLPPTVFEPIDGLALYPSPPVTRDVVGNQGGFLGGSRVDSVSYVIQRRGRYTLPAVTVRWMNSQTRQWQETTLPAVRFHAWWGSPAKPRFSLPGEGAMPTLIGWLSSDAGIVLMLLAVLGWLAWHFRARLLHWRDGFRAWRYRRRHSEAVAFAALKRQRHAASAAALYPAVDAWVRRCAEDGGPATIEQWCAQFGDASLKTQWLALQSTLYGQATAAAGWSASGIVDGLASARRQWQRSQQRKRRETVLPPLNPA